ncbi:MAG: response regulator transcription factor [Spirosomataceae bacterium]
MKILLLEDDAVLSQQILTFLKSKLIDCDAVFDGETFFRQIKKAEYDAFLLDINVPKINGLDVCKEIRLWDFATPIIMLTAYGDIQDKIDAFSMGADDYLVKPFHFDELYIRLLSLRKRSFNNREENEMVVVGDLEIDTANMKVYRQKDLIDLTPREFKLLLLLANAKGKPLTKQTIAEQIWNINFDTNLNTIEVYINFLRKKIDKNYSPKLIHTRPGFGYYLKPE